MELMQLREGASVQERKDAIFYTEIVSDLNNGMWSC
jgi:hypothetical protein